MKILLKQTTHTNTDDVTNKGVLAMFRNVDMFLLIQSLMRFYLLLIVLHLYIYLNVYAWFCSYFEEQRIT